MRAVSYKSVLYGVATRLGIDPTTLQTTTAASLAEYITEAVRHAWEMCLWPEWTFIQERTPVANVVSLDQAGQTAIGEVLGVWATNPDATDYAQELNFELKAEGIFIPDATATVWVKFTGMAPEFSASEYAPTTAYAAGDVVYFAPTTPAQAGQGECYMALQATTGNLPTVATHWALQVVPKVLGKMVKHAALASALREDGQYDKAGVEDRIATAILESEQGKILDKQRQNGRFGCFTR